MANPFEVIPRPPEGGSTDQNTLVSFVDNLRRSFDYALIDSPRNAAVQIINHCNGREVFSLVEPPRQARPYSPDWVAQQIGGGLGTALPFMAVGALGQLGRRARGVLAETQAASSLSGHMLLGGMYGGIFTPVEERGNFLHNKLVNGAAGALSFGAMNQVSQGFRWAGTRRLPLFSAVMRNESAREIFSGLAIGTITADIESYVHHGHAATLDQRLQSAISFGLLNASLTWGRHLGNIGSRERGGEQTTGERAAETAGTTLVDQSVSYGGDTWRVRSINGDRAVIVTAGIKQLPVAELQALNQVGGGSPELRVGESYRVSRTEGGSAGETGWRLLGYVDEARRDTVVLGRDNAIERTVPIEHLRRDNAHLFPSTEHGGGNQQPNREHLNYGLVAGREVQFQGRSWHITDSSGSHIDLARSAEYQMPRAEFEQLNGGRTRPPAVGDEVFCRVQSGEVQRGRVVAVDTTTGSVRVWHQAYYSERVSLGSLLVENPRLQASRFGAELQALLQDPGSRLSIEGPCADGHSGHCKYVGYIESADGSRRVRVIVHDAPAGGGVWNRLRNDQAARIVAAEMGQPESFPLTVTRDGKMVQAFVGEGTTLHEYLREQSGARGVAEADLEPHIRRWLEELAPSNPIRTKLSRAVAFSILLGDTDPNGTNFMVQGGTHPAEVNFVRIDGDYAFSRNHRPTMDRFGSFGGSINGLFSYFSGRPISTEVLAEMQRLSERLNRANQAEQEIARNEFANETRLAREQVDALAERARYMLDTGHFPTSRDLRMLSSALQPLCGPRFGERMEGPRTVPAECCDIEAACLHLARRGISETLINYMRRAHQRLSGIHEPGAQDALRLLTNITHPDSPHSPEHLRNLCDLIEVRSRGGAQGIDFADLGNYPPDRVASMRLEALLGLNGRSRNQH